MKRAALLLVVLMALAVVAACGAGQADLTADQIVTALQEAGLEADSPQAMTADDYGLTPFVGKGVHFLTPSVCNDCGGRVYVGTPEEIDQLAGYYKKLSDASALFFSWVFETEDGRALIQINGDMPEADALRYKAALEGIGQ